LVGAAGQHDDLLGLERVRAVRRAERNLNRVNHERQAASAACRRPARGRPLHFGLMFKHIGRRRCRRAAPGAIAALRAAETIGRPLGAPAFLDRLAALIGRDPRPRKHGPNSRTGATDEANH